MLSSNYLVTKSHAINEMRYKDMTLQEMRLFTVYLSRINKDKISTRRVRFKLEEFKKLMGLNPKTSIAYVKKVTENMLKHVITEPKGDEGQYSQYQIFKKCEVLTDKSGDWSVYLDAHDDVLPLMFEYKNRYFRYKLWNTLRLTSPNQIRMFEILKQYENTTHRSLTITLADLKEKLDIDPEEYTRWDNFKTRILTPCQKALKEYTDICFTYKPIKNGKAITALKFFVEKNDDYDHQLSLDDYIDDNDAIKTRSEFKNENEYFEYVKSLPQDIQDGIIAEEIKLQYIETYKDIVEFSFTENEMSILYDELHHLIKGDDLEASEAREEALYEAYDKLRRYERVQDIGSRLGYLITTLKNYCKG